MVAQLDIVIRPRTLGEPNAFIRLLDKNPGSFRTKILDDEWMGPKDLLETVIAEDGDVHHATIHFPINTPPEWEDQEPTLRRREAYRKWLHSLGIPFSEHPISYRG